ncbi:GtrA family protein [Patescibacteria group bacterium]|nr:GtrA family protein [Patescibacteria group bacterium]MCL5733766.1 GtrA family protein [Patescibacteria group bacterium]
MNKSTKKDFVLVIIIGALVGLLIQPIIANLIAAPSLGFRILIFVGFLIIAPAALLIAYLLGRLWKTIYQFAKFAAVGALNTFIDFGVLNLEILLSGVAGGALYPVFKGVSFLAATTNSFFWNKFWTFESKTAANPKETLKFYFVAGIGWLVNVSLASFVVNFMHRPGSFSPNLWANVGALAGVAGSFLWDFLGYKFLVFRAPNADLTNNSSGIK